ncbi:MAG TPA: alpha/beta hydrolase [Candidatus Dormibacteraeota bacterium]|nr:alpha/beta hydrolase [Candidatus Dormibacteraeota bacterium]
MTLNDQSLIFPTVVCVPCFSGAPWDLDQLGPLASWPRRTMRLPERLAQVEAYADALAEGVNDLDSYVLAGDSFGAVISLTLALRQPVGLAGLVLSGGFPANPLPKWKGIAGHLSRYAIGPLYHQGTLRIHAYQLHSTFDAHAEVPQTQTDYRRLFVENTPRRSYSARVTSVAHFDVVDRLRQVNVPTLIITPADDRLVGEAAAKQMLDGIAGSREVVLPETGHMFRFTHPTLYAQTIADFLAEIPAPAASAVSPR